MAQTKVSALTELTSPDGSEELLVNDGGTSKKVTIDNLLYDEAIDSDHYVDGSIDNAHIADDAIDSEHYVDGSIDTAHIADDAVTADKLANAINTSIDAKLPLAGGTMTGSTIHNDNVKDIYGTSSDGLEIYHSGADSYIIDSGTGDLYIRASNEIRIQDGNEANFLYAVEDGDIRFYYGGSQKLATTNTGIDVTGTVTADGGTLTGDLTVSGASTPKVTIKSNDGTSASLKLQRINENDTSTDFELKNDSGTFKIIADSTAQNEYETIRVTSTETRIYTNNSERMRIDSSGNVGIGTASPDQKMHILKGSAGSIASDANAVLTLENSNTSVLQILAPEANNGYVIFGNPADGNADGRLQYSNASRYMAFWTAATERLRIDSSGNVGIGDTDPSEAKLSIANVASGDGGLKVVRNLDEAGSNPLVHIIDDHDNNTQPAVSIRQDGAGYGLYIDQNGNHNALYIDSESTSYNVLYVNADTLTDGAGLKVLTSSANLATTAAYGFAHFGHTGNSGANVNNVVYIHNDHASSTGTTALYVQQDSTGPAAVFDGDVDITGTVTSSGDLTLDVGEDIILDADSGNIKIYTDSSYAALLNFVTGQLAIQNMQNNADISFKGSDDDSVITALTLDMSEGGKATFRSDVVVTDGNLVIDPLASGKGIDFSQFGAGTPAEVLNDYEEGTFTATLYGSTSGSVTTGARYGTYTKIGNLVTARFTFINPTEDTSITGDWRVGGLPFTVSHAITSEYQGGFSTHRRYIPVNTNGTQLFFQTGDGTDYANVKWAYNDTNEAGKLSGGTVLQNTLFSGTIIYTA